MLLVYDSWIKNVQYSRFRDLSRNRKVGSHISIVFLLGLCLYLRVAGEFYYEISFFRSGSSVTYHLGNFIEDKCQCRDDEKSDDGCD